MVPYSSMYICSAFVILCLLYSIWYRQLCLSCIENLMIFAVIFLSGKWGRNVTKPVLLRFPSSLWYVQSYCGSIAYSAWESKPDFNRTQSLFGYWPVCLHNLTMSTFTQVLRVYLRSIIQFQFISIKSLTYHFSVLHLLKKGQGYK